MIDFMDLVRNVLASEAATGMTSAAVLISLLAYLGYQARQMPANIARFLEFQFTVSMTVVSDQPTFHMVDMWLARQPAARKVRRLTTVSHVDRATDEEDHHLTLGQGRHLIRADKRFWLVDRNLGVDGPQRQEGGYGTARRQQTITITTLGRDVDVVRKLLGEIRVDLEGRNVVLINVWSEGWYRLVGRRAKRPLDTIHLDEEVKNDAVADVRRFLGAQHLYAARTVPWRRGYLFTGPPGTGKSSFIVALASEFSLPVYIINPATLRSDAELHNAINSAGRGAIVIEDIDASAASVRREDAAPPRAEREMAQRAAALGHVVHPPGAPRAPDVPQQKAGEGLTLSGLLNAIDGIAAQEGRVLFLTTNRPGVLDEALKRPGRIDRVFHLGPAQESEARAMFQRFFPEADADAFVRLIAPRLPMAQAELQNIMLALAEAGDPVGAAHEELARRFAA